MCLIVVGWRVHADYPLLLAANRDEFHARPTAAAARWPDAPQIIGGRDLEAGGTWLAVSPGGRLAAVTNVREPGMAKGARSRGELTRNFLLGTESALDYATQIDTAAYSGYNLLLSDGEELVYASNRDGAPRVLTPGIYGLSNHRLDSPWPKLEKARAAFAQALATLPDENAFFSLLTDSEIVADDKLPQTGVPLEWERLLSAIFVQSTSYGTRASSVVRLDRAGNFRLHERSFGPNGELLQSSVISTGV